MNKNKILPLIFILPKNTKQIPFHGINMGSNPIKNIFMTILYILTILQQLYNGITRVECNPLTVIKLFFLENLKLFVFGLLLLIWPTGLTGILLMACFLVFEAGVYVNYTAAQRNQIAIVFSCLTLNFLPFIINGQKTIRTNFGQSYLGKGW